MQGGGIGVCDCSRHVILNAEVDGTTQRQTTAVRASATCDTFAGIGALEKHGGLIIKRMWALGFNGVSQKLHAGSDTVEGLVT